MLNTNIALAVNRILEGVDISSTLTELAKTSAVDNLTFADLAKIVAKSFYETMKVGEFETFDEMKDCYWWTTKDIKDEVDYALRDATDSEAYIDELDHSDVFIGNSKSMPYNQFSALWRKELKQLLK